MKNKGNNAKFGYSAFKDMKGALPNPFPRIIGPNAKTYLDEVIDSGLTVDMTGRFEKAFADAMGVKHCVSAPGCSQAILMLAEALDFDPGDEIIFSPITDYGTIMGFIKNNYIPVFADTEPGSVNISAKTVEPCITERTKAIVCVHKTGVICDMDPIMELAREHGLIVVEDACQAVYGRYKGRLAGTIGDVGAFSFDSEKTMGSDVGGCFITNNDEIADYARFRCQSRGAVMRDNFGREHVVPGSAIRMPHCTAAINLAQLEIIQDNVEIRDKMARLIYSKLNTIDGIDAVELPSYMDVYSCWMFGFTIDPKEFTCTSDEFAKECQELGISGLSTARYYFVPEACTFLQEYADQNIYPYSEETTSRRYDYRDTCPNARSYLENFLRATSFCEKYTEENCGFSYQLGYEVAKKNRKEV